MLAAGEINIAGRNVRLRPIALPAEHGGWSLLLEPIILGLLLAPSVAGVYLSLAALSAFLLRHPLKLTIGDWRRKRRMARTRLVHTFTLIYAASAILFLAIAMTMGGINVTVPLSIAAPLVLLQLSFDFSGRSRALIAELAGSIAVGSIVTAIALGGGWALNEAFVLWLIVIARSAPTILYLRTRLRLIHGKAAVVTPVIIVHVLAIVGMLIVIQVSVAPRLSLLAMFILFLRTAAGLSGLDTPMTAKKLGLRELAFGAITVLTVATGFLFHW